MRWQGWAKFDATIDQLHPSMRWDVNDWHSPKTLLIECYSRVLVECWRISNDSSRLMDVMIGAEGCRLVNDRRKGSDLCELTFSRCVERMGDKATKRNWMRMLAKIVRQARRQVLDPALRASPMFSLQNRVYEDKTFQSGFRACICKPSCVPDCIAADCAGCSAKGNRRTGAEAALVARDVIHPEPSTRNLYHVRSVPQAALIELLDEALDDPGESGDELELDADFKNDELDPALDF